MSMLITILSRAEIVRQFTDGAAATQLVTFGGHILANRRGFWYGGTKLTEVRAPMLYVRRFLLLTHPFFFYYETELEN